MSDIEKREIESAKRRLAEWRWALTGFDDLVFNAERKLAIERGRRAACLAEIAAAEQALRRHGVEA